MFESCYFYQSQTLHSCASADPKSNKEVSKIRRWLRNVKSLLEEQRWDDPRTVVETDHGDRRGDSSAYR